MNTFKKDKVKKNLNINYFSVNDVSVIIKPETQNSGDTFFYDLSGNRVSKIPRGKRDQSIEYNCYLGLKKYKTTERWEIVNSDEVNKYLNDKDFILEHSLNTAKSTNLNKGVKNKSIDDVEKLWEVIQNDITEYHSNNNLIEEENNKIDRNTKKLNNLRKSILIESTLKKLPSQGIGSVKFYNSLNKKKDFYDNQQFSNIVRFLDYVESLESEYRRWYTSSHQLYDHAPSNICFEKLYNTYDNLNTCYSCSQVLINDINKDLVNFNKVYNNLEDQGFFLSKIEKIKTQNLINISNSLGKLNKGITKLTKVMKDGFNETNMYLNIIDNTLQDTYLETNLINDRLFDIEMSLWK